MAESSSYSPVPLGQARSTSLYTRRLPKQRRQWQPGVVRRLPWTGLLAIVLALGCACAAISIAMTSDGQELDHWKVHIYAVQPAVLLSIFATLANALLVFAFTQGATINWWTTACRGATLGQLHSSFHFGSGLTAIFSSVSAFNAVALAGVFMPILLVDGPLLQRSTSVKQRVRTGHFNRTISLSPDQFHGATGIIADHSFGASMYHPFFAEVLQQYENRDAIHLPGEICSGDCEVEVVAAGWDIQCSRSEASYLLANWDDAQRNASAATHNLTYHGPEVYQTVFEVDVDFSDPNEFFNLTSMFKSTPGASGKLVHHHCLLRAGTVRYPLQLRNNTVSIGSMPASENRTVQRYVPSVEMTGGQMNSPSSLGGFGLALSTAYETEASIMPVGGWYRLGGANTIWSQYLRAAASALASADVVWADPMGDMLLMANELAFRFALATTTSEPGSVVGHAVITRDLGSAVESYSKSTIPTRNVEQNAVVTQRSPVAVYSTHHGYLAGGVVLICIACVLIVPTYWGWWRLGRSVSMSPLEIARAFDAPMLQLADPNATGDDVKRDFGHQRVTLAPKVEACRLQEEHIALTEYGTKGWEQVSCG